jgi:ATP-dependent helicase/nuclease subunit A
MLPTIMKDVDASLIERAETYRPGATPAWAGSTDVPRRDPVADLSIGERLVETARTFGEALSVAATPIAVPIPVTRAARATPLDGDEDVDEASSERTRKAERSRYGTAFGSTVHRAIELGLGGARGTIADWVRCAAREHRLEQHLEEAAADVDRALAVVRGFGSTEMQVEYPVCMGGPNGTLLVGIIDLLLPGDGEIVVLDYKTDAPPAPGATLAAYPVYRRQLELYVDALKATGFVGDRRMRTGLLFTGSGRVLWS